MEFHPTADAMITQVEAALSTIWDKLPPMTDVQKEEFIYQSWKLVLHQQNVSWFKG